MKLCKVVISDNTVHQMTTSATAVTYFTNVVNTPFATFVCPAERLGEHLERSLTKVIGNGPKTRELSVSLTEIDIDDEYIVESFRK